MIILRNKEQTKVLHLSRYFLFAPMFLLTQRKLLNCCRKQANQIRDLCLRKLKQEKVMCGQG